MIHPPTGTANRRRPLLKRWIFLLPAATVILFSGLTALSLIEMGARRAPAEVGKPVSADVLARYEKESARLGEIREARRSELTAEGLGEMLRSAKPKELPVPEKLVADFRALEKREPEAGARLLPGLLALLKQPPREGGAARRRACAASLLSHIVFSSAGRLELKDAAREDLLDALDVAIQGRDGVAGAMLLLISRAA